MSFSNHLHQLMPNGLAELARKADVQFTITCLGGRPRLTSPDGVMYEAHGDSLQRVTERDTETESEVEDLGGEETSDSTYTEDDQFEDLPKWTEDDEPLVQ